jgi:hypothetical protein
MRGRTRQPFGQARVRGFSPNLLGAIYATHRGVPMSSIGKVLGDTTLSAAQPESAYWRGHRYWWPGASTTGYGYGAAFPRPLTGSAINAMSIACLAKFNSGFTCGVFLAGALGGTFAAMSIAHRFGVGTNELGFSMRSGNGNYYEIASGLTESKLRFCVARLRKDGPIELWADGVLVGTSTHVSGGNNTCYTTPAYLTTYVQRDANNVVAYGWDRWISDSELRALTLDPFMLLDMGDPIAGLTNNPSTYQYARPNSDIVTTGWAVV